jgi:hypothetical protein
MEINPKDKTWNPQEFVGYSERHGAIGEPATTGQLQGAMDQMRDQQRVRLEQERLLGETPEYVSPQEVDMIKNKMVQRLRGY